MQPSKPEVERRLDRFRTTCRQAGVKVTHQRLEIFREVAASPAHPDAEMVYRAIQPGLPTVSLDTVYRTLWLLTELGLVRTLGPRRESVRFDANLRQHHHYVCVRCRLTCDFESRRLDGLRIPPHLPDFGSVLAAHVEVRGLCSRCAERGVGERERKRAGLRGAKRRTK